MTFQYFRIPLALYCKLTSKIVFDDSQNLPLSKYKTPLQFHIYQLYISQYSLNYEMVYDFPVFSDSMNTPLQTDFYSCLERLT